MDYGIFSQRYGAILAMDVHKKDEVMAMLEAGEETEGIVAYKMGGLFRMGLLPFGEAVREMRELTPKPLIVDQQKLVPDYVMEEPGDVEMMTEVAGKYAKIVGDEHVDGVIIYPALTAFDSLPQTVYTKALQDHGLNVFVLGRITTPDVLRSEGGGLPDETPKLVYEQASREDVEYFIMPGNMHKDTEGFMEIVLANMPNGRTPKIGMPGFGSQRGEIKAGFKSTLGYPTYAIIGPADCIDKTSKRSIKETLKPYCDEALSFL